MLGWALNKATGNASNAPPPGLDDSCIEPPDTPAPVFAARAFRRAFFGTPAPPEGPTPGREVLADAARTNMPKAQVAAVDTFESPSRPQGILLTPGTGTSRRKRVSFGCEVKSNAAPGGNADGETRPRTRLQEALEKSRRQDKMASDGACGDSKGLGFGPADAEGDDAWEEVDELDRDPDMTIDLNEPHSQSGRYWQREFQKYHDSARAEMEKLVKYKRLAKSYAKIKDAEALGLNEQLQEERAKVVQMEQKIAELSGKIATGTGVSTIDQGKESRHLVKDLTRQTALTTEHSKQVEELEILVKKSGDEADRNQGRCGRTSLPIAQTLLDTQVELKKAREQVEELSDLRQKFKRLEADLSAAEQRELKLEVEKTKVSADLAKTEIKVADLQRRLSRAEQDRQRKDSQYEKLKADYDFLKKGRGHGISKTGDAQRLQHKLTSLSAGHDTPSRWAKKLEDSQAKLRDEQEARRREMEDASATISNLRHGFEPASESKPLEQRFKGPRTKGGEERHDDDHHTHGFLRGKALMEKQIEIPVGNSTWYRSTREASEPIPCHRLASIKRDSTTGNSVRQSEQRPSQELRGAKPVPVSGDRTSKAQTVQEQEPKSPALGLARERSPARRLDVMTDTSVKRAADVTGSRRALSADRRFELITSLAQKRAERRRANEGTITGKENERP